MRSLLTVEEERALFAQLRGPRPKRALRILAEQFTGFAQAEAVRLAGKNADESETRSLANAVLLAALRNFDAVRGPRFSTYLHKALERRVSNARARAIDQRFKQVRYSQQQQQGKAGQQRNTQNGLWSPVVLAPEPDEANLHEITREYLRPALRLLRQSDRRLLGQYYFRGRTLLQIAACRGVTKQAISLQLRRALRTLREKFLAMGRVTAQDLP